MPDPELVAAQSLYVSSRMGIDLERHALPDGGELERPAVHHPGGVAVLAQNPAGALLLVRQYRYPLRRWTIEIPAGTRAPGEDPAVCAAREMEEETGFRPSGLTELLRFLPAPGLSDEELIIYRVSDYEPGDYAPDQSELIQPCFLSPTDCVAAVADGTIADGKTLLALALLGWWPELRS